VPVNVTGMSRLAHRVARQLKMPPNGTLAITFIDCRRMRALNRRFLGHDRSTDVLGFRYDGEAVCGEILIAPREAQTYATTHKLAYEQELGRYVIHGLLHWLGHEDRTPAQQRKMRRMEDQLLMLRTTDHRPRTAHGHSHS
jgi:probable rRNA maturation factor